MPLTSSSSGSIGMSRLRRARHRAKAPSGSTSPHTTAPAQPSSGSSRPAASIEPTAFQGNPHMSSAWATSGGAGSGNRSRGSIRRFSQPSPPPDVPVELELADLRLVVGPFGPLVPDEPFEDVLAERLADEIGVLH